MKEQEIEQIKNILINHEESQKKILFLSELEHHPVFWGLFSSLNEKEKKDVDKIISEYIEEKISLIKKTKWGQLFARFAESNPELFRAFRKANDPYYECDNFQELWKQVEIEMFKLEGILTEKMLKQEKGLDKVIDSFYNIVYLFFPKFNEIE